MGLPINDFYKIIDTINYLAKDYGMEVSHFVGGEGIEITLTPIKSYHLAKNNKEDKPIE